PQSFDVRICGRGDCEDQSRVDPKRTRRDCASSVAHVALDRIFRIYKMVTVESTVASTWDVERIRGDFPVLQQTVNGKPLIYLDNSASSQVPQVVIDRGSVYLEQEHSNIHRGVHYLSMKATTAYEGAREKVKQFINERESRECIFVRGATEGINLVMHSYGRKFIGAGDEII